MSQFKVLWIDDDINGPELMSERDALEELGCNITPISHPDQFQIDMIPLFDCIIIDLAMPNGTSLSIEETRGGLRTGFVLLKKIKKKYPDSKLVVYSVFDALDVRDYCNGMQIAYWNKSSLLADDFALSIFGLIEGGKV